MTVPLTDPSPQRLESKSSVLSTESASGAVGSDELTASLSDSVLITDDLDSGRLGRGISSQAARLTALGTRSWLYFTHRHAVANSPSEFCVQPQVCQTEVP